MAGFVEKLRKQRKLEKLANEMSYQPFYSPIPQGVVDYAREVGGRIANPANTLRGVIDRMKEQPADEMAMDWANPVAGGLVGMFAGKGAKTANLAMLAKAEKLAKKGVPDPQIWKETGWTLNTPDKMPRFEIPDNKSFYRGSQAAGSSYADEVMLHPELYKQYPSAGTIKMIESPDNIGGSYSDIGREQITLGQKDASSTALHELQHAIQQREGFARGGSPETSAGVGLTKDNTMEYARKAYEQSHQTSGDPLLEELLGGAKKWEELTPREQLGWIDQGRMTAYRNLAGEAEARLTQARMAMTPEQRLAQYPYEPEYFQQATGVPLSDLIVRKDGGKAMSLPAKKQFGIAHEVAQRNAALPIEQGGLGLPPNNTAMERAKAMGVDPLFDTIGLPNKGRELIQSKAEEYAQKLRDAGVNVMEVTHSGSAAGPSSYIKVAGQPDIRISGHSKGVFNTGGVINVGSDDAFNDLLTKLPKTVRKATPEDYARLKQQEIDTMYPIRLKSADKKLAKGKGLTFSEQEAIDWRNAQRNSANILAGGIGGAIGITTLADLLNQEQYQ